MECYGRANAPRSTTRCLVNRLCKRRRENVECKKQDLTPKLDPDRLGLRDAETCSLLYPKLCS
jgi:hypothetical protein